MMKIFIFAMLVTTIAASTTKPSIDVLNGKSYLDVFILLQCPIKPRSVLFAAYSVFTDVDMLFLRI